MWRRAAPLVRPPPISCAMASRRRRWRFCWRRGASSGGPARSRRASQERPRRLSVYPSAAMSAWSAVARLSSQARRQMICCKPDVVCFAALLENGAPIMPSRISDTSAEAERAHITLLRSASPARRLQLALGLSRETLRLSWRGLRRAHPHADERQIRLLSLAYRYGQPEATAISALIEERDVMPMQPDLLSALTPVISVLHDLGVPYFVGGSVASSMYGMPRSTLDVDLVTELSEEHVAGLVERLGTDYYLSEDAIREAVRAHSSFNLIHLATMLKIDIFVWKARPFDQEAFHHLRDESVDLTRYRRYAAVADARGYHPRQTGVVSPGQ